MVLLYSNIVMSEHAKLAKGQSPEVVTSSFSPQYRKKFLKGLSVIVVLSVATILGVAYYHRHYPPRTKLEASIDTEIASAHDPQTKAVYYVSLAQVCLQQKNVQCAQQAAASAQKLNANDPSVLTELGDVDAAAGNKAAALSYYNKAKSIYEQSTLGTNNPLVSSIDYKIQALGNQ
jgi:tetratricopeptide (TPR) repeat protein